MLSFSPIRHCSQLAKSCAILLCSLGSLYAGKHVTEIFVGAIPSVAGFYDFYGDAPVLVKGAFTGNEFLRTSTLQELEKALSAHELHTYKGNSGEWENGLNVKGDEFFANLREHSPEGPKYNLFGHPLSETPFSDKVELPFFLRDNWLAMSAATRHDNPYLALSGQNTFSRLHEDAGGAQNWMYLAFGEKKWLFYPPGTPEAEQNPEHAWETTMGAGDLLFFPPGWLHEVRTTQDSFGIGGDIINEHCINKTTESVSRLEKKYGNSGTGDVRTLMTEALEKGWVSAGGRFAVQEALARLQEIPPHA